MIPIINSIPKTATSTDGTVKREERTWIMPNNTPIIIVNNPPINIKMMPKPRFDSFSVINSIRTSFS